MRFSDLPFDDHIQLFPSHEEVQRYLEHYAESVQELISFNKQITEARPEAHTTEPGQHSLKTQWSLRIADLLTGQHETKTYDAVIVASGHFSVPFVPDIPGLSDWNELHPGTVSHSKYYRVPEAFAGKRVIVVGNSASGLDIASQIVRCCQLPLLQSSRSESFVAAAFRSNSNIENVPEIVNVDATTRTVHFKDGRTVDGIDTILFCTGYLYSLPFVKHMTPNPIGDGTHVENTYQHLFYIANPTICFLTLPQKVVPFAIAEAQSAVVARIYSGRLALPPTDDMYAWNRKAIEEQGSGREFHTMNFPKDANYINVLYDWALKADARPGLENADVGKLGKRWEDWEFWARERFPAIRKAFVAKGRDRRTALTLEDVGFSFEDWKTTQRSLQAQDHGNSSQAVP